MRYMVFSESALEDERGIPAIDTFIRYRDTRYQIWVYCTKDPMNEILLTTPLLEGSHAVSKLSNPINPTRNETFILPRNLRDIVIGLNEPSHEINLPYVTMKKKIGQHQRKPQKKHSFQVLVYYQKMALKEV